MKNKLKDEKVRRVCIFCECWESGGIESFIFNVLSNIDLNGLEIDIAVSRLKDSVFTEPLKKLGIGFYELSGNQRRIFKNRRMFIGLLKKRGYDAIHLNIFHALSFIYGAAARQYGVPIRIVHSHNSALRSSQARCIKKAIHILFKNALCGCFTDYWACSREAARFMFTRKFQKQYVFIPNGINTERFAFDTEKRAAFRKKLNVGDKLFIVNVGRLSVQKNQNFLLDTAFALNKTNTEFILLLAGEGDMEKELKAKAKRLGIEDKVIFFGTSSDIPSILSAADVFALPSLFEGLAVTAVEAQTADLPVICSENISEETFVTENIFAVPLKAEKWVEAIAEVSKKTQRDVNAGELLRKKGFDIEYAAENIESRYRGILKNVQN